MNWSSVGGVRQRTASDDDALVAARSEPLAGRVEVGAGRVADKDDGGGRRVLDLRVGG